MSGIKSLPSKRPNSFKSSFDLFDPEGSGFIHPSELKNAIISLGVDNIKGQIYQRIHELEAKNELINYQVFVELMCHNTEDSQRDIAKLFNLYDTDGKGYINEADLLRVAEIVGQPMGDEQIRELLQVASGRTHVQFEQFYSVMTSNSSIFS